MASQYDPFCVVSEPEPCGGKGLWVACGSRGRTILRHNLNGFVHCSARAPKEIKTKRVRRHNGSPRANSIGGDRQLTATISGPTHRLVLPCGCHPEIGPPASPLLPGTACYCSSMRTSLLGIPAWINNGRAWTRGLITGFCAAEVSH